MVANTKLPLLTGIHVHIVFRYLVYLIETKGVGGGGGGGEGENRNHIDSGGGDVGVSSILPQSGSYSSFSSLLQPNQC